MGTLPLTRAPKPGYEEAELAVAVFHQVIDGILSRLARVSVVHDGFQQVHHCGLMVQLAGHNKKSVAGSQ